MRRNAITSAVQEESDEIKFTSRQLKESLQALFPNDWVSITTSDGNNTKGENTLRKREGKIEKANCGR